MTRSLILIVLATLTACGSKKAPAPAAAAQADAPAEDAVNADIPDTKDARAYVDALVGTTVKSWAPISADGAEFEYDTLNFTGDGNWHAEGYVEAQMERFECTETGTWTLADVQSASAATMVWAITKTDCPSREVGHELRVLMTLEDGSYEIKFR